MAMEDQVCKLLNYLVRAEGYNFTVIDILSVYFSWPDPMSPPSWQLLGFITNNKPSAIFKITKLKPTLGSGNPVPTFGTGQISHNAQIGVSIEPLSQIASQSPNAITEPSNTSTFMEFAQRVVQNLFDYVASFAVAQSQMTANPNESYIPMSAIRSWYNNFLRKLELNPQFWRSWICLNDS